MGTGDESQDEDVNLMQRIAAGEEAAFSRLVDKHQYAVHGTIARMTNHSPDTPDLAQEVFLRVWKSARRYQPRAKFTTWLFTITRNLVFNYSSKKSRHREESLEEKEDGWHQQQAVDRSATPDHRLQQAEMKKQVDQAIASLPEKQRLAVILRRQEKMPYEEIAVILNLSIPAVKSTLFRARNALREALAPYLTD